MSTFQPSAARTTVITVRLAGKFARYLVLVPTGCCRPLASSLPFSRKGWSCRIVNVWDSMSTSRALSASGGSFMRKRSARGSSTMCRVVAGRVTFSRAR